MARKLTKPKVRTKTKIVRQQVAQPTQEKEPQNEPPILKPIKPTPPLPNQRIEF